MTNAVPQISADELKKALDKKENIVLLDVRTPQEFAKKRIDGSINLPLDRIEAEIAVIITDKNQKVFAYCLSGSRSNIAADTMIKLGYCQVFSLTSGLLAWGAKKYPLV